MESVDALDGAMITGAVLSLFILAKGEVEKWILVIVLLVTALLVFHESPFESKTTFSTSAVKLARVDFVYPTTQVFGAYNGNS